MTSWVVSHVTVTSRAARQPAFTAELGVRCRELGTAVVAEPARTGHPSAATTTTAAGAAHVATAVGRTGTGPAASRHRTRRTVAVCGAVAVRAVAAVRLAGRSIGTIASRSHDASSANVTSTRVLRAAAITTS